MKRGMGLLSSLLGKKMKNGMDDESSVSITIEKEMDESDDMMGGGMTKYAQGGGLKMVDKGGQKVPFFAADGKGKMMAGGPVKYAKGGRIDGCAIKGKTKGTYR
jgi:hypothetical protein